MKDKILMLIIGVLLGAVITAGCFIIFNGGNSSKNENMPKSGRDMENFVPGERPDGEMPGGAKNKYNNTSSSQNTTEQNNV